MGVNTFHIGEIAIIHAPYWPEGHGRECEVLSSLHYEEHMWDVIGGRESAGFVYEVGIPGMAADGICNFFLYPWELRKKRPPAELGSWDEVQQIWNPTSVAEKQEA